MSEKPIRTTAPAYAWMLPSIVAIARANGYAIGIHGSISRDLDLIAAPWVEEAAHPTMLARAVRDAVGGSFINPDLMPEAHFPNPGPKPHGRLAFSIYLPGGFYIDLSVMPPVREAEAVA